jgi:uncharacterized DUF497 family protein
MRFQFDPAKSEVLRNMPSRGIGFDEAIQVWTAWHFVDLKSDDPEQWRAIGWVGNRLYTVIYEDRRDESGAFIRLGTLWRSTREERSLYEEHS